MNTTTQRHAPLRWLFSLCIIAVALSASVGCEPGPIDVEAPLPVEELEDPEIGLCDEEPDDWAPRPRWGEITSGKPDYQNLSSNLNFLDSIKLLTSMFTKATAKLESVQEVTTGQVNGNCLCNCDFGTTQLPGDIELSALGDWLDANAPQYSACFDDTLTRQECNTYCDGLPGNLNLGTPSVQTWNSNDLFLSVEIAGQSASVSKRTVLELIHSLDGISAYLQSVEFQGVLDAMGAIGAGLQNFADLIAALLEYVDRFTSGYHLGAYTEQRPDLHMCVGYAGHAVFAQMGNLGGENVSIGARYSSHNLSRSHRAQFRTGGFAVNAFGKSLSLMPSAEANIQVNGFGFWNAQKPFGIPTSTAPITSDDVEDYDIFQLVEPGEFDALADANGNVYVPGSLFISNFYPASYTSADDGQSYTWPRPQVDRPWEEPSIAIMSAGLNLKLDLEPLQLDLPTITVYPGAYITPYFKLGAGVEWIHDAYVMRDRIRDKVNENIPAAAQLQDADFAREMHAMQAPDVSEDNGTTAYVTPEIGAHLLFGVKLAKWLELGISANVGVGVKVQPGGWGGVVDLNYALVQALVNSNPPVDAPCNAVFDVVKGLSCNNKAIGQSDAELSCENGAENACETLGYCVNQDGEIVAADVTEADCLALVPGAGNPGDGGGQPDGGRCCMKTQDPATGQSEMSFTCLLSKNECVESQGRWVNGGVCSPETNPEACSDPGDGGAQDNSHSPFKAYSCVQTSEPKVTGWEGDGCHPLGTGFMSACGCDSDADCTSGETCNVDGVCVDAQSDTYTCACDPQDPNACGDGRTCSEGACLMECAVDDDCAQGRVCDTGLCRPPHGIPTAEEIVWGMQNVDAPLHAVSSYALSDLLLWAYLTAGIDIKMAAQIFGKSKEFKLFDWSDAWELASTYKIWYQPGLEARYQDQCSAELGAMTNHQPQPVTGSATSPLPGGFMSGYVERYPETPLTSVYEGNAGSTQDFIDWCKEDMKENVENPVPPKPSDIGDSLTDLVNWGEEIGLELWSKNQLCIDGQPWEEWTQNVGGSIDNLNCEYRDPETGQAHSWLCRDALKAVVKTWGCLEANLSPASVAMAMTFPHLLNGSTFDLNQMLIDPSDELSVDNLKPQYRYAIVNQPTNISQVGEAWMNSVESCFDARWDTESVCECSSDADCQQGLQQTCGPQDRCIDADGNEPQCSIFTVSAEPGPCGGSCRKGDTCIDASSPDECIRGMEFHAGESCN